MKIEDSPSTQSTSHAHIIFPPSLPPKLCSEMLCVDRCSGDKDCLALTELARRGKAGQGQQCVQSIILLKVH